LSEEKRQMDDYDKILSFFGNTERTEMSSRIWCDKYLIKLMDELLGDSDDLRAENCIILILNLFLIEEPDHCHNKGKSGKELKQMERAILKKVLNKEFMN